MSGDSPTSDSGQGVENAAEANGIKAVLKGLALLLLLGASVYFIRQTGLIDAMDKDWIDLQVRGKGAYGALLYVGVSALFIALGMPRQIFCFLGGYAFGFVQGTILATLASGIGCVAAVTVARTLGREAMLKFFGKKIQRIDDFVKKQPFTMAMTIRFFPMGSNLATNIAAGVSSISAAAFVLGSVVGYLPQTIVFALFGSGVNVSSTTRIVISVVLFILSTIMGVCLYRKHRRQK